MLITIPQAMKILGISKSAFYRLREQDGFPAFIHDYVNKHVDCFKRKTVVTKYRKEEIEEWKNSIKEKLNKNESMS